MNDSELPYISVILTAYNRKDFLLNAIKSVINQTLDKKYYEIILITNYQDTVNSFINEMKVNNILMDGTIGEFLYAGVKASNGEILAFLDDDDLFTNDKLEIIYNKFKDNKNLCYYHNAHISVNKKYRKLDNESGKDPSFNMSSISVRKSILSLDNVKKINYNPDHFMYLSALESGQKIVKEKEKLTYYMIHNSASGVYTNDINEFIKRKTLMLEMDRNAYLMFCDMFISKKGMSFINGQIAYFEIAGYMYGNNIKPKNIWNIFKSKNRTFYSRLIAFLAYILVRLHINFRDRLIEVLFNSNKKMNEKWHPD